MASLSHHSPSAGERRPSRSFLPWSRRSQQQRVAPSHHAEVPRLAALREQELVGNWQRVYELLRPLRLQARSGHHAELLELFGQCARRGLDGTAADAAQWLTDALWAFQADKDGGGMVRAHRQLGQVRLDAGQLAQAQREVGYAETLARGRQLKASEALELHLLAGRVALMQGDYEEAAQRAHKAQQFGERAGAGKEAVVRALAAEALVMMGRREMAAVQLLWAERIAHEAKQPGAALRVALGRAEALLTMDCPRRAAAVLGPWRDHEALEHDPQARAHWQRLWGQAHVFDHPPIADESLSVARKLYTRIGNAYHAASCELTLVRCMQRQHAGHAEGALDQLGARLPGDWRLLHERMGRMRSELSLPSAPALGAVRTPWLRQLGQTHVAGGAQEAETESRAPAHSGGLWQRLHSQLGGES